MNATAYHCRHTKNSLCCQGEFFDDGVEESVVVNVVVVIVVVVDPRADLALGILGTGAVVIVVVIDLIAVATGVKLLFDAIREIHLVFRIAMVIVYLGTNDALALVMFPGAGACFLPCGIHRPLQPCALEHGQDSRYRIFLSRNVTVSLYYFFPKEFIIQKFFIASATIQYSTFTRFPP